MLCTRNSPQQIRIAIVFNDSNQIANQSQLQCTFHSFIYCLLSISWSNHKKHLFGLHHITKLLEVTNILTITMNCSILWVNHRMYKVLCSISQDIDCCSCCCCNLSSRTLMVKNRIELRFSDSVQCCFDSYKLHATSTISGSNQSVKRYISRSSMIPALKSDPWLLLALIEVKRVLLLYLPLLTFGGLRFLTLVFTTNYNNV